MFRGNTLKFKGINIKLMLFFFQVDVDKRWTAEQLLDHDFLKKASAPKKIVPLIKAAKEQLDKL